MKILQVAYRSKISGGEKVLFDLATSMDERGHEVSVVCPDPGQATEQGWNWGSNLKKLLSEQSVGSPLRKIIPLCSALLRKWAKAVPKPSSW